MEMIIALAMKFWQWTILIAVVIVAAIINFTDKRAKTKLKFYYNLIKHNVLFTLNVDKMN